VANLSEGRRPIVKALSFTVGLGNPVDVVAVCHDRSIDVIAVPFGRQVADCINPTVPLAPSLGIM
jgi:hypothetical protein